MPFGAVTKQLGIANARVKNAASFIQTVLSLPTGTAIYQQQLVHNRFSPNMHGPTADAAWCGVADDEAGNTSTIRQISACDTQFARRNLDEPLTSQHRLTRHQNLYSNQIYYLLNEPELASRLNPDPDVFPICVCWDPRDRVFDQYVASCFPSPNNQYWETRNNGFLESCGTGSFERIRFLPLAYLYLRLRKEVEDLGQGHIVLPPASSYTQLGRHGTDPGYYQGFYDYIHNTGAILGNCSEDEVPPSAIHVLHIHRYSEDPVLNTGISSPLFSVAYDKAIIRDGVDWYKDEYVGSSTPLPIDILLSEMGYDHNLDGDPRQWAGGWEDFLEGLSWWNSYLCWLTRFAKAECNLGTGREVHPCIQVPESPPYTTANDTASGAIGTSRNQWYLNANSMTFSVLYNKPAILCTGLTPDVQATNPVTGLPYPGVQIYQNSFLKFQNSISWDNKTWRRAPFGASYTVWSQIGSDLVTADLNTGWIYATSTGVAGTANVILPEGYSTVFFAVYKDIGEFDKTQPHQVHFRWYRSDGIYADRGYMALNEFQDTDLFAVTGFPNQTVYSAMVYPVVCYSHPARQMSVELSRNISGPNIWLGRPIVMPGICSWFIHQ